MSYSLDDFTQEQKTLIKAIKYGDINKVATLIKATDLNLKNENSIPILTVAIYEARNDLNKKDKIFSDRIKIITALMRANAPFDKRGSLDESPLNMSLFTENPTLLKAMLDGGLNPNYIDDEKPIIFNLLDNYKLESLKLLIQYGADINIEDSSGETPAHAAIIFAPKISYYLVSIGANLYSKNKYSNKTFFESVLQVEKNLLTSLENVKRARTRGDINVIKENLDAVIKIKQVMSSKGVK